MFTKFAMTYASLQSDAKAICLSIIIILLLWKYVRKNKDWDLIMKLPGPPSYPVIGNLLDVVVAREKAIQMNAEREIKYGQVYRLIVAGHPVVMISHPQYVEEVLRSKEHLRKGKFYKFIIPFLGYGLITSAGEHWFSHRRILTPAFHFKILESFLEVFREQSNVLIKKLEKKADEGVEFDIHDYVRKCSLDIICETSMGVKINAQDNDKSEYAVAVNKISELASTRGRIPWLHSDFVFSMTSMGREMQKHLNIAHSFVDEIIRERKEIKSKFAQEQDDAANSHQRKKRLAFLDLILEAASQGSELTDKDIREEVNTIMFAGHDTTTAAITWCLFLLGHHQNIQNDLFQEQMEICEGSLDKPIAFDDLNKMDLLDRVIKETLRIYPSVPIIARRLDHDVKFGDYTIPGNSSVVLNIFGMHRNPEYFPNPEKFDPDRFLPGNTIREHPYAYIPFSAGPRNCIGKRFALMEEKVVLSTLIRHYEIQAVEQEKDMVLVTELILRSLSGINLVLKKRSIK